MTQAFDRSVVEIHVGHFELGRAGNVVFAAFDSEAMILRRDQYLSAGDFLYRMISAAMTVRHFHRSRTIRESQDLMSQADTENRYAAIGDRAHSVRCVVDRGRIAGAVREVN